VGIARRSTLVGGWIKLSSVALFLGLLTTSSLARGSDRFDYKLEVTPGEGPIDPVIEKRFTSAFAA
jgi:hypothetical protein